MALIRTGSERVAGLGRAVRPGLAPGTRQGIRNGVRAVADTLPNGSRRTLAGQAHDLSPEATAAALEDFLSS